MSLLDLVAGAHVPLLRPSGGCHNCPRKKVDFVPAILCKGSVLFLGETPGNTEVEKGELFVGHSGQLLRAELEAAGVPQPWSFSNAVHCRTPEGRPPNAREMECCLRQFVLEEVRDYRYVVLMGNAPLQAFFPGAKGTHFRGNFAVHPDFPGQLFYNTYHPSYILRRPDLKEKFQRQLERLGRVGRGQDYAQTWEILRGNKALSALEEMANGPLLSFDLETSTNKSWVRGARAKSICATDMAGERVVALSEEDPQWRGAMEVMERFLRDPGKGVTGSNVSYDIEWLERHGGYRARLGGIFDVGIIWYEAGAGRYKQPSLKTLVAEELDGYRALVHMPHEVKDVGQLLQYNAEDVIHSLHLFKKGMTKLGPKTRDLVTRVIGPMALVYQRAHTHGIYIRDDYRRKILREHEEKRKAAVLRWKEQDPDFIPDHHESGKGLAEYLFEIKRLPVLEETESGAPSTDKNVVKAWVRGGATYLENLLEIREVDKFVGTFIAPLGEQMDEASRIHPTHWVTSTDTSRPSSSNPNVYNIPRKKVIRNQYGAPPGGLFIESDLSQIEFRIMVCLAKDETGIEAYCRGDDAHTATARVISGNQNPTKEQRSNAKPVNFGNLYGAHWRTAQAQALNDYGVAWTDAEAQSFQEAFFATYKKMRAFHDLSRVKLIANRGWFESVTGHIYHYRDWDHPDQQTRDHCFRSALNAEAQGPAANICFLIAAHARRLMDERGLEDVAIVNSVYDSVQLELPDKNYAAGVVQAIDDASKLAHEWVKSWFVVPLLMEHEVGEAWGSLEKWSQ